MEQIISVVTGSSGFVGSHLVDYLLQKGHKVKCIVRKTSNLRWLEGKDVEIFDCGLYDKDALKVVLKNADYLFHVAGVVKAKNEEGYFKGNVETTKNLLVSVNEENPLIKRIVIVSSQTAAGPSLNGIPVKEEDPPNPITTYGRSKVAQEKLSRSFMDKLQITIVRPPAVFGERDTEIYLMFKAFKKGIMTLIGFNEKKLSLIYVADLVEGLYLASIKKASVGQTYFISSEEYYNWNQIGNIIAKSIGKNAVRIKLPHFVVYSVAAVAQFFSMFSSKAATFNIEKAKDFVQEFWTCDTSKAVKELGYSQKVSLEEGIKRTIDWYRANNWL